MAERPVFVPVFEEDENTILERLKGRIGSKWNLEDGDYMYDAVATVPLEVKQSAEKINRDYILKNNFPQYAEGDYMDLVLEASGGRVQRKAATPNRNEILTIDWHPWV